jgi:hypothetical protein
MKPGFVALITLGVVVVVVAVVLIVIYVPKHKKQEKSAGASAPAQSAKGYPRMIWTYWNSKSVPLLVEKCLQSWRRHHPDHEVRLLTPDNVHQYMDVAHLKMKWNDSPARESDIVRLNVLAAHGGVWADATVYLYEPFAFLNSHKDFVGYYIKHVVVKATNSRHPAIESWCFATRPNGAFITKWRDAFMSAGGSDKSMNARVDAVCADGVELGDIYPMRNYLFVNVAAQVALQKKLPPGFVTEHMLLYDAEQGPLKYAVDANWDADKAVHALATTKTYNHGFIKLWGPARAAAEKTYPHWIEQL